MSNLDFSQHKCRHGSDESPRHFRFDRKVAQTLSLLRPDSSGRMVRLGEIQSNGLAMSNRSTDEPIPYAAGPVRGFLHRPLEDARGGLVLAHSAGGNSQAPLLVAAAEAFAAAGYWALRCDLPFRQRKSYGPPPPAGAAEDRANLREAARELRALAHGRIVLGGHSYGGRQATMLAAEDPSVADALLLLSYPLHPPNQPAKLRTAHFPQLRTPAFFLHGSKDPFGSPEEMRAALSLSPAATALTILERAGHELLRGRFDLASVVVEPFQSFMMT